MVTNGGTTSTYSLVNYQWPLPIPQWPLSDLAIDFIPDLPNSKGYVKPAHGHLHTEPRDMISPTTHQNWRRPAYIVNEILDFQKSQGWLQYLVDWEGYRAGERFWVHAFVCVAHVYFIDVMTSSVWTQANSYPMCCFHLFHYTVYIECTVVCLLLFQIFYFICLFVFVYFM